MASQERSLATVLRIHGGASAYGKDSTAAIDAVLAVISPKLTSWGVFAGVQRRVARLVAQRLLGREWLEYTLETIGDRVGRGEVKNPGALFVTYCKVELQRHGHQWSVVKKGVA